MKATQLPSGSYRVQVVVGKDEIGKRIVKSFTGDTADEAIFETLKFKNSIGIHTYYVLQGERMPE